MFHPINRVVVALAGMAAACLSQSCVAQAPALVEFFNSGRKQQGLALIELTSEVVVLGRDGGLHSLDPRGGKSVRHVKGQYKPLSSPELRNDLRREFGNRFEVVATNNFLVVQPKGRGDRWPNLFEQSHRGFVTYMSKRGVKVRKGRFPMVAVVYPDQREMYQAFRDQDIDVSRVAGIYSNNTNRVMTHDGGILKNIAATVRHEAAHQSGFNSGVHSRVADTPKWITEGIGQMFEPAAMINASRSSSVQDRVNRESMQIILKSYPNRSDPRFMDDVISMLSTDDLFSNQNTVHRAYSIAWAMMFYLAERQPKAFAGMLRHTAGRPSFRSYSRSSKLKDVEKITGMDPYEFAKRVNWYVHSLK